VLTVLMGKLHCHLQINAILTLTGVMVIFHCNSYNVSQISPHQTVLSCLFVVNPFFALWFQLDGDLLALETDLNSTEDKLRSLVSILTTEIAQVNHTLWTTV